MLKNEVRMNIAALTTELTTFLVPFLPFLAKAGEEAAGEVGKTLTAEAWENAKKLWVKLWVKVKDRPAAQEAVQDVAKDPQDKDAQAALRNQLKKLLCEDQDLANE